MHRAFLAALLIVLFAAALPVAGQDVTPTLEPNADPCTPELDAAWERWLQGLAYADDIADEIPMQYSLMASYLQTGIDSFGASECDRIRADYYQLASIFYSFFTTVQAHRLQLELGDSAALYALQEMATDFSQGVIERSSRVVVLAFADYLEQE